MANKVVTRNQRRKNVIAGIKLILEFDKGKPLHKLSAKELAEITKLADGMILIWDGLNG